MSARSEGISANKQLCAAPTPAGRCCDHIRINVALSNEIAALQVQCVELREELSAQRDSSVAILKAAIAEATRPAPSVATKVRVELAASSAEHTAAATEGGKDDWSVAS